MVSSNSSPKWWRLYLTLPLLIGLFVAETRLNISSRGHQTVQIGIVLLVFGLIYWWVKANASALTVTEHHHCYGRIVIHRIDTSELPEPRPMFQLPDSERIGVLSDTFEMDYIDTEALPIDNVSQGWKKE